jgi:hypothetical protein
MRWFQLLGAFVFALAGCSGPPRTIDSPSDENAKARRLYVAKCARCHKLYDPAKYTDADWQQWMDKMGRKAKLKPEQKALLTGYIDSLRTK